MKTELGPRDTSVADVCITLGLGIVFALAYLGADEWAFKTALFPRLISAAGMAMSFGRLAQLALRRGRPARAATPPVDDASRVLRESSARSWIGALTWLVAFFASLALAGTFVTVPAFAFAYILLVARAPLWAAVVHAVVAASIVYFVFGRLLAVPLPDGTLF